MQIEVLRDAEAVARRGAELVAEAAREAIAVRGLFTFAVSGGSTPWQMLRSLGDEELPWREFHFFQVDERVAPEGDPERNLTHLRKSLLERIPLPEDHIHAMPVDAEDLEDAAARYTHAIEEFAGSPPVLDLVHLGMGADGHTASLVPDDPVLEVGDRDVAICGEYQGRRRMTVTYPLLDRARGLLWLLTGAGKAEMLPRLMGADSSIPAGRVRGERAVVVADESAAALIRDR